MGVGISADGRRVEVGWKQASTCKGVIERAVFSGFVSRQTVGRGVQPYQGLVGSKTEKQLLASVGSCYW